MLPIWKSGINHHFMYFITIFFYLKRYILTNIIIVLLFPIAAICRSENHTDWEKKNNGTLIWLIDLFLFVYNNFFYHIFCCNMFVFACSIIGKSQCWLFVLRANTGQISVFALICPYMPPYSTSGICAVVSKIICQSTRKDDA